MSTNLGSCPGFVTVFTIRFGNDHSALRPETRARDVGKLPYKVSGIPFCNCEGHYTEHIPQIFQLLNCMVLMHFPLASSFIVSGSYYETSFENEGDDYLGSRASTGTNSSER